MEQETTTTTISMAHSQHTVSRVPIIVLSIINLIAAFVGHPDEFNVGLPVMSTIVAVVIMVLSLVTLVFGKTRGTMIFALVLFGYMVIAYLRYFL